MGIALYPTPLRQTLMAGLAAWILTAGSIGIAQAGCTAPALTPGSVVALTGTLQRSVALGGETTGWRLVYATPQGRRTIEVDFSSVAADQPIDGARVAVTGIIVQRIYIERGATPVLRVQRLGSAKGADVDCGSDARGH